MKENNRNNRPSEKETVKETVMVTTEVSSAKVETNGPETKNGIIYGAMFVNVRREPWTDDGNVLEVLRKGDKVTILGMINGFYKVSTSMNKVAYISSDFIKEE